MQTCKWCERNHSYLYDGYCLACWAELHGER